MLGAFLRSRRENLSPVTVGLKGGPRRRTSGLRREEVAELAGIGVDWYVRLEQGRAVRPSGATIDAIARALRLSKAEHAHMQSLAHAQGRRPFAREIVPGPIIRLVESMNLPAYITGRRWDVLAWNAPADELFGFSKRSIEDCNVLLYMLTDRQARRGFGKTWVEQARRMVAIFRTTHDLWDGDPAFTSLLERLHAGCSEFGGWWAAHDIGAITAGQKSLTHAGRGKIRLEYATFQCNDSPDLRLTIYKST